MRINEYDPCHTGPPPSFVNKGKSSAYMSYVIDLYATNTWRYTIGP